ncbi:MAG TPA: DUF4262 domain-containing protein [Longimicrobium sp.]|jgi:hypothetical protein
MKRRRISARDLGHMAGVLQEVVSRVQAQGWTYIYTPFEGHPVAYGYTVGFTETFGFPEAVVLGLAQETIGFLFARLAEKLRMCERPPLDQPLDLGLTVPLVLRAIPAEVARTHLKIANVFYEHRTDGYEAVQVVWPDAAGRFPWEAGYERAGNYQPQLFQGPPPD